MDKTWYLRNRLKTDQDRKSVVEGKSVDLGGRRIIKKEKKMITVATPRRVLSNIKEDTIEMTEWGKKNFAILSHCTNP